MKTPAERPGYKWVIAAVCFLTVTIALGFFYNTLSLFLKAVTEELGIPRSLYAATSLASTAASVLIGAVFGKLAGRVRVKTMMLFAVSGVILTTLVYAFAQNALYLVVFWFLEGTSLFFCSTTMISYVINSWFTEHRSTVMGVVMAGSGIGAAVGTQILRPIIIGQRSVFGFTGYRAASCVNSAMLLLLLIVIAVFFRDPPTRQPEREKEDAAREGPDWETVRRRPMFYLLGACVLVTCLVEHAPVFINAAHMEDIGLQPTYLTNVMSIYAATLFVGKILTGLSGEKLGLSITMTICNLASVISTVCLCLVSPEAPGYALAHAILLGCAIPMETVMLPLAVSEMFGQRCYAKIMGLYFGLLCIAYAAGDLLTNGLFDRIGSYRPILFVYAGIMLLFTIAEPIIFAYGRRERAAIAAAEHRKEGTEQ